MIFAFKVNVAYFGAPRPLWESWNLKAVQYHVYSGKPYANVR